MPQWSGVTVELNGTPARTVVSLSRVASVGKQARVQPSDNGLLLIDDRWHPRWTVMLVVMLFPFGLLALLHRQRGQLVVAITPTTNDRTQVYLAGDASRRVSAALWQAIGESLADDCGSGAIEPATSGRWGRGRQSVKRWARAHPWTFSVLFGIVMFGVCASGGVDGWRSGVDDGILAVLLVLVADRALGLWPGNRFIHWHAVRLPPMPQA